MASWETVKTLGLRLPEVAEGTSYGTPALKVREKMFVRLREPGVAVVWVDLLEREALTQGDPEIFYVTDHYREWPLVLIQLERVDERELEELLIEAWRMKAPKRVVQAFDLQT